MRSAWVVGPAVALLLALAAGAWSVSSFLGAREQWRAVRDRLGSPGYDPTESDRRYDAALAALEPVQWSAVAIAVTAPLLLAALCARLWWPRARRPPPE